MDKVALQPTQFIKDHYGPETACTYDSTIIKVTGYQEGLEAMAREAIFTIKPFQERTLKILDLGCGTGNGSIALLRLIASFQHLFRNTKIELHLYDQSVEMTNEAVKKIKTEFDLNPIITIGKIEEMEINDRFHLIISSYALHHFQGEQLNDILANINNLLKPSGAFLLVDRYIQSDQNDEDFNMDVFASGVINSGMDFKSVKQSLIKQMEEDGDVPCTIETMTKALKRLGLTVRQPYKSFITAMISARKQYRPLFSF